MASTTISFVADAQLAARVKEIAKSDGVTQSQAAARASSLGALLTPAARRTLRFVLDEGGEPARQRLSAALAKAIAQVANTVLEQQLLAKAESQGRAAGPESDDALAEMAVTAVAGRRRQPVA